MQWIPIQSVPPAAGLSLALCTYNYGMTASPRAPAAGNESCQNSLFPSLKSFHPEPILSAGKIEISENQMHIVCAAQPSNLESDPRCQLS
jgi:hypothetical protein